MTVFLLAVLAFLFGRNFLLKQSSAETLEIPNFKVLKFLSVLMLDFDFSSQFFKNKITWFSPSVTINFYSSYLLLSCIICTEIGKLE